MSVNALQDEIEAAAGYEDLLVPALFQQWAEQVMDAAQIRPGQRVLDVGCGTGVLAREAVRRVGPSGFVSGVDPAPGMLAMAKRLAPTVEWQRATAELLPFPNESFDAVVSQFGLMFCIDRCQALREMVRVLTPQGYVSVAVWDALENMPAYATEVELLDRLAGIAAANAVRAPFVLGSRKGLVRLFEDAGVPIISIATHRGTARFPNIRTMVEADLRGWLPMMGIVLDDAQIEDILAEAETALGEYVAAEGTVEFDLSAHIVTGTKP